MGKRILILFIRLSVFWYLIFALSRLIFLSYNYSELSNIPFLQILSPFYQGIYIDTSTLCYFLAIPWLLLFVLSLIPNRPIMLLLHGFNYTLIFINAVLTSSELELYKEWGVKMNMRALYFMNQPMEVVDTVTNWALFSGLFIITLQIFIGIRLYHFFFSEIDLSTKRNYLFSFLFFIGIPPLLVIGLRGGLQEIPIQQSDAYYSKYNILNLAAVNSVWNLGQSYDVNRTYINTNPYVKMDLMTGKEIVRELYQAKKDSTIAILTTKRPNVVTIILEGWGAAVVKELNGLDSLTPSFKRLSENGLLFSKMYASGERSDQGIAAILSAYPALPNSAIINEPSKYNGIPCLSKSFREEGYSSSFLFGGQLSYGNIKGYIYFNQFDRIIEGKDFADSIPRGGLCVHDGYVFDQFIREIDAMNSPFFSTLFTASTHSPYDFPMTFKFNWKGRDYGYVNSIYYADSCLGAFFEKVKSKPWYNNTLFIIVADHSHISPKYYEHHTIPYQQIPCLFYGNVLKEEYKGFRFNKIASQVDIASTLLNQCNLPDSAYTWSKNLFNPLNKEFAYYGYVGGYGWIEKDGQFVFEADKGIYNEKTFFGDSTLILNNGHAYMQTLFQEYLDF